MKIGLVCPYNVAKGGGVKEILLDLRAGLIERGHDVTILAPRPRDLEDVDTTGMILLGNGTDFKSPTHTTSHFSVSVDSDAIDQILEQEQFDVLHFHEPWVPVLSRQILSRSNAVNIATFHGALPETLMSQTIIKVVTPYSQSILKYIDEFTAVSPAAAQYISSLTDEPIKLIPNGIDLTRYTWADRSEPSDAPMILYVGRLEKRKGVNFLLQAFRILQASMPGARLVIAGDGPDREKLELLAEDLQLQHVDFKGFVSEAEKLELLATCDLFCSPAIYGESFGLVLLEAMASGAVTVAGNNAGYAEVMSGLGQVSIVNPQDPEEFARKLRLLLTEPALRKLWLSWAKKHVKQFAYPRIIDMYEQSYKDALAKHAA